MQTRNAASNRRVDSFSAAPAIRARARKRRSSTPSKPPVEVLRALARLRAEAEAEIERLIDFLDSTDVDCDLEDTGDTEPNFGCGCLSDGDELEQDSADDEPSLGWPEGHVSQGPGMYGSSTDVEIGQFIDAPKGATQLENVLSVESSYRSFVRGLTPTQKAMMEPRLDHDSWVVLR